MGSKKLTRKSASNQNNTSGASTHPKSSPPPTTHHDAEPEEDEDFCQRFFGDPLFTNLNVLLLFLLATFLPMVVWIPHFIKEYARLRQTHVEEGERLKRIERSRLDFIGAKSVLDDLDEIQRLEDAKGLVFKTPFSEDDVAVFEEDVFGIHSEQVGGNGQNYGVSALHPQKPVVLPTLCPDGRTYGFDNWFSLRDAISEANALAAVDFLRWNKYLVMKLEDPEIEEPIFSTPDPFVICPGAKLNQRHPPRQSLWGWISSFFVQSPVLRYKPNKNKLSSIFINAEDITIECDRCLIDLPGTHFSFGPHAKNAWIKGVTFKGATTSSLTLHHHGASASFEGCYWLYNSGGIVSAKNNPIGNMGMDGGAVSGGTMNAGAVADVNSTSAITFYRCFIDDHKQNPRRATVGAGLANVPGMNPTPPLGHGHNPNGGGMVMSSFTIRT